MWDRIQLYQIHFHSPSTLLGTPAYLLIDAIIQLVSYVVAVQYTKSCRYWTSDFVNVHIKHQKNVIALTLTVGLLLVPDQSLGLTVGAAKKHLLMSIYVDDKVERGMTSQAGGDRGAILAQKTSFCICSERNRHL